jgi:N-hydroxyarylamine O-acetyltransferase
MSDFSFNFEAYLKRIGVDERQLSGDGIDELSVLKTIMSAHLMSIPFENLDIVNGKTISMELEDVFSKLVLRGRGGYCFEHNTLLAAALKHLSFHVVSSLARVCAFHNHHNLVITSKVNTVIFIGAMEPACRCYDTVHASCSNCHLP